MFTASVDALKWFLMEQAHKAMFLCHTFHDFHSELVVVNCHIGSRVDGGKFMLRRSYLVVFGFCRNTELPELFIQFFHESGNSRTESAEIVVIHFLTLRSWCAKQSSSAELQIVSLIKQLFINQEILLFRTNGGDNAGHIFISEEFQDTQRLAVDGFHRTQKRGFGIKCLAAVGTECGRDAECIVFNKCRGGWIPGCITSCLKGGTKSAGWETGCIRFALYQLFAGEIHDNFAIANRVDETVVLLSSDAGHRLEPVCEMSCTIFNGPFLHCNCDCICNVEIQMAAIFNRFAECLINISRQFAFHDFVVEYKTSIQFGDVFFHNSCLLSGFMSAIL